MRRPQWNPDPGLTRALYEEPGGTSIQSCDKIKNITSFHNLGNRLDRIL